MANNTVSIAIPEATVAYIDERVASGEYGNRSEYIRDLVRKDETDRRVLAGANLFCSGRHQCYSSGR